LSLSELRQEVKRWGHELSALTENLEARIEAAVQKATKSLIEQNAQKDKLIKAREKRSSGSKRLLTRIRATPQNHRAATD